MKIFNILGMKRYFQLILIILCLVVLWMIWKGQRRTNTIIDVSYRQLNVERKDITNVLTTTSITPDNPYKKSYPYDVLIVGAGLSGAVLANLHATLLNQSVLVVEKRNHIAGNLYDYTNKMGIRVSQYGAHLFHTNEEKVWRFVNKYSTWIPYEHRVVGKVDGKLVPIPVNIQTVNSLMGVNIKKQEEMKKWLANNQEDIKNPKNGEEAGMARVGKALYEKIFKDYTKKQWDKYPIELDPSILQRIPVRDNFDDRYFPQDPYQALPQNGYTRFVAKMLDNSLITVKLQVDFLESEKNGTLNINNFKKVFFTGPIDHYYASRGLESLEYRSINFEIIHLDNIYYYQSNSVVNYPQGPHNFTRIVEYKHFYAQEKKGTTIVREYSTDEGDPYYPVLNDKNRKLYSKYKSFATLEVTSRNVYFVGRLASFKYFNMDQAIMNAIDEFTSIYSKEGIVFKENELYGSALVDDLNQILNHNHKLPSISIITSHCEESLKWLNNLVTLCDKRNINIYIYHKCGMVELEEEKFIQNKNCNVKRVDLQEFGGVSQTWLFHMLYKSFDFKDINLFLSTSPAGNGSQKLLSDIGHVRYNVESFNPNEYIEIARGGMKDHFYTSKPEFCSLPELDMETGDTICKWYKLLTGVEESEVFLTKTVDFLVTEVMIRRTLSIHRQWMEHMLEALSRDEITEEELVMNCLWATLFKGSGKEYRNNVTKTCI